MSNLFPHEVHLEIGSITHSLLQSVTNIMFPVREFPEIFDKVVLFISSTNPFSANTYKVAYPQYIN